MDVPLRTRVAGVSMMAGAVLMAIPAFLPSEHWSDNTWVMLRRTAAQHEVGLTKSLLFQVSVLLVLPGVVAIIGRTRGRGSRLVESGGCVYAAGLIGAFVFESMSGVMASFADGRIDRAVVEASDRMESSPGWALGGLLAILAWHLVGLPWLSAGMARARQIPRWLAALATVGTVCAFFGSGTRLEDVGWVIVAAGLTLIGATVFRPELPLRTFRRQGVTSSQTHRAGLRQGPS